MSCGKWFHPCNCNCVQRSRELQFRTTGTVGMPAMPSMGWCGICVCNPCTCHKINTYTDIAKIETKLVQSNSVNDERYKKVLKRLEELEKHLEKEETQSKATPLTREQKCNLYILVNEAYLEHEKELGCSVITKESVEKLIWKIKHEISKE